MLAQGPSDIVRFLSGLSGVGQVIFMLLIDWELLVSIYSRSGKGN